MPIKQKLFPVYERGTFKSIALGLLFLLTEIAVLYYGNVFVESISRRVWLSNFGHQLFGAEFVMFIHGLQVLLLFLAWFLIGDGVSRYFGVFELAIRLLVSSAGILVTCLALPLLSRLLAYSFPLNVYISLLLMMLFQILTLHVENWVDKGAAMMLWIYSFQSLELLPMYLDGQASSLLFGDVLGTREGAGIVGMAGSSLSLSFLAGAVISTWVLASYSAKLSQVRRSWNEQREDDNESLRQVNMVDMRNLVHDLKNPLAAIKGTASMLRGGPEGSVGAIAEKADVMLSAANYMERMIGEILHENQLRHVKVETFFSRLERQIQPFPWGEDVTMEIAPEAARETMSVNEIHFTRALLNVLDNASRANRVAGDQGIELRVRGKAEFLEIEILDNGPGIKSDLAHKVKLHLKSGWGSTGLGLAFARRVAAVHGGTLLLSARRDVPHGTSVLISLPRGTRGIAP